MKLSRIETFMRMAENISQESPDKHTQVGAVLISSTGRLIASGFNGFSRGANDSILPLTRPEKYQYMIHAETNLLYNCLDEGISTRNSMVICTLSPCINCLRACWNAGVTCIVYKEQYRNAENYEETKDIDIKVVKLDNGFTKLELRRVK